MASRHVSIIEAFHSHRNLFNFFFRSCRKHAHLLLDDSPNFDYNKFESTKPTEVPSSSCQFQWPSQKNQSIPPTIFYKPDCDTSSRIEKSLQSHHQTDLYRKSRSTLLDAADREHYANELAKPNPSQTTTGGSSLLSALDEDYGVRENFGRTVDEEVNSTISPIAQLDCIVDIFAGNDGDDCERKVEIEDKLMEMEQSVEEDGEEVIPCSPQSEKSLKRNKKQRKITDLYPKLNVDQ